MAKSVGKSTRKKVEATPTNIQVERILVSQPKPSSEKSPYYDLERKLDIKLDFHQFIKVEGLDAKEFRKQNIDFAEYMGVVMLSRNSVDHFFRLCEETKYKVPTELRYFCATEAIALYLQKFILYRKRKVFFSADGSPEGLYEVIDKFKDKGKILMPVSEFTKNEVGPILTEKGIEFNESVMYRSVSNELSRINENDYQLVIFYSPFGIEAALKELKDIKKKKIMVATFGNSTKEAAEKAELNIVITAPTPAAPSMVTAIELFIKKRRKEQEKD